ncbi:hypothetical protein WJX84_003447 [Apatococcus fuscideae]|uniref:Uncharacterized protein n=1 Tax=Apatococcus fuscideae TaxID=2026836 RepID=A0AAW1TAT8_9CHLO
MSKERPDEVARNSIWRERCKKESACRKLNLNFSIPNPDKMIILPLKPNNTVPVVSKLSPTELLEVTSELAKVCNTKHTHKRAAAATGIARLCCIPLPNV